jgi:F1F0 ATPase subunit 2
MTWIEAVWLVLTLLAGGLLGLVYFSGLWWTTQQLTTAKHPALLFLGSFLVRLVVVLGGFYLVAGGRWERMIACLAGFLLARSWLLRRSARREFE